MLDRKFGDGGNTCLYFAELVDCNLSVNLYKAIHVCQYVCSNAFM